MGCLIVCRGRRACSPPYEFCFSVPALPCCVRLWPIWCEITVRFQDIEAFQRISRNIDNRAFQSGASEARQLALNQTHARSRIESPPDHIRFVLRTSRCRCFSDKHRSSSLLTGVSVIELLGQTSIRQGVDSFMNRRYPTDFAVAFVVFQQLPHS